MTNFALICQVSNAGCSYFIRSFFAKLQRNAFQHHLTSEKSIFAPNFTPIMYKELPYHYSAALDDWSKISGLFLS